MSDRCVKCFKWRESNGRRKWTLNLYNVYPDLGPKGTANRGPYCINQIEVTAAARKEFEERLSEIGAEPVENYR